MALEQRQQTISEGLDEPTQPFRWDEYDLEGQAFYVMQARKEGALEDYRTTVKDIYQYELNGNNWVRIQYDQVDAVCFHREHANVENLEALSQGDGIVMTRTVDGRKLRGNESLQHMIAQINSDRGVIYQSPGFNMPDSIEVPAS